MANLITFLIAIIALILGIPLGNLLKYWTRDEMRQGQKWFRFLVAVSLLGALTSLILLNDVLLFTFLFIAIVTSGSLRRK